MNDLFLNPDEPVLMGIVNVTPDSFSDGGQYFDTQKAIEHGLRLRDEGAKILDIGGESTRPNATPVTLEEEQQRVVPVVEGLRNCGVMLSVDTRNASTMLAAIKAGAGMVNDVSALTHDPESLSVIAESGVYVCLMHMKGTPQTMQANPHYDDVVGEVYGFLEGRIAACLDAGVNQNRIIIDPGIGFGKRLEDNINILKNIEKFHALNTCVLLGASRKRFISDICTTIQPHDRVFGSIAAVLSAYQKGARLFRVHDVAATKQALDVFRAVS